MLQTALQEAAKLIDKTIKESGFLNEVEPGYLGLASRAYPELGGKRLRPAILLWSAGAAGGDPMRFLPQAAALEVFHNWTLVHDDIIDNDEVRRGKPTAHVVLRDAYPLPEARRAKYGCDMAILAGDLMQAWAFELLAEGNFAAELKETLARKLRRYGYIELISGEALDVEMSCRNAETVTAEELFHMQSGKTGALLRYAAQAGWTLGKGDAAAWDSAESGALSRFAEALALAFQLRDDYLGIYGDFAKFGKPIGSDLEESKATLLLIYAFKVMNERDAATLRGLLGHRTYTQSELALARKLLTDCGAEANLQSEIARLTAEAEKALAELPASEYRTLLGKLAEYLITREL